MNENELIIKELLLFKAKSPKDLSVAKRKISKKEKVLCPSNIELLKAYHNLLAKKSIKKNKDLEKLLRTRPVRSLSGIVNVSVLTKPYPCPGKCIYCPFEKGVPKSYVSGEPAVERAKRLNYDPYLQVKKRIEVLELEGHSAEKIDLRIIGGTWSYYPKKYQFWFIKRCFDACNNKNETSLEKAQKRNEKAKYRVVGLSFETRPDFIDLKEVKQMKKLGATKIELGVQSIYDDVLKFSERGHDIKQTIKATKLLKNAGFKVAYQLMLNLPKSNPKRDLEMFKEIFNNPDFKPDYIKIYPCALVKEAPLYQLYLKKKYKPYTDKVLIETIKKIKKIVPRFIRIERIIRDIPSPLIVKGGTKISNLRQIIEQEMKKENWQCQCIRCREIKDQKQTRNLYLFREDYEASQGKEILLTFEDKQRKNIYSLLRLRIPSKEESIPILKNCDLIRELHTYGQAISISQKDKNIQHQGFGKKLIKEAENISKIEFKIKKIAVISGVGVKDYYKKIGYKNKEDYMIKILS